MMKKFIRFNTKKLNEVFNIDSKPEVLYEEYANATSENTNDFCLKFLETIACNRAFVRCVRNFLNINIVGVDELDNSRGLVKSHVIEEEEPNAMLSPQSNLEQAVANNMPQTSMNSSQNNCASFGKIIIIAIQKLSIGILSLIFQQKKQESFWSSLRHCLKDPRSFFGQQLFAAMWIAYW